MSIFADENNRMSFGGLNFTSHNREQVTSTVLEAVERHPNTSVTVVTPNIYHLYLTNKVNGFAAAVNSATIVVPDGWPVVRGLRVIHQYTGHRIAGSDLFEDVLAGASDHGMTVSIIGGSDTSRYNALLNACATYPGARFVNGGPNPELPDQPTKESVEQFIESCNYGSPDIVMVCFGAPKSEMHLSYAARSITASAALCVGASVDFMSGERHRAPRIVQSAGLEWAHRLVQDPRRLGRRYIVSARAFIGVIVHELRSRYRR